MGHNEMIFLALNSIAILEAKANILNERFTGRWPDIVQTGRINHYAQKSEGKCLPLEATAAAHAPMPLAGRQNAQMTLRTRCTRLVTKSMHDSLGERSERTLRIIFASFFAA